jgi:CubicO group peptidase (beta-lactamase class C family)
MRSTVLQGTLLIMLAAQPAAAHPDGAHTAQREIGARPVVEVKFPTTTIGAIGDEYIRAFNSGEEAMRSFLGAHIDAKDLIDRPMDVRLGRFRDMKQNLVGLHPVRIGESAPTHLVFVAKADNGDWLEVTMDCKPEPPHGLLGIRLEQSEDPGEGTATVESGGPMTASALRDSIDHLVDTRLKDDTFAGVIQLVSHDKQIYARAAGLAERRFGAANRLDTKFNLGSINKAFTKVAIGQLAEQGRLALTDSVGALLPDNPVPAARGVTVQQLLDHRSGLGDYFTPRFWESDKSKFATLTDFVPMFADAPLEFAPGSRERYSNAGYVVLGLIIEKLSGESYYDYVREHIFTPAGMTATDSYEADRPIPNLAIGYSHRLYGKDEPVFRENTRIHAERGSSAGGGYSNAADLVRFADALKRAKLLAPAWSRWMFGDVAPSAGARVASASGPTRGGWGIAGGAQGMNAVLEIDLDRDCTLVILANMDPPVAEQMDRQIRRWIARTRF